MTHTDPTIRRRPDGTIDTGHYIRRGNRLRRHALRNFARAVTALWRRAPGPRPAPRRQPG